jgi:hypothetical protein
LGAGALGVIAMTTGFALRDFGSVVTALADSGGSVWALCAFAVAVFAGVARVVRAFGGFVSAVERIVKIRDPGRR